MKPKFTKKEILDFFYSLSLEEVIKIVKDYDKKHKVHIAEELEKLGFKVIPSQANFLFAAPPDGDGAGAFQTLRDEAVIVRYFPGEITGKFLRITIGTPEENSRLLEVLKKRYN